MGTNLNEISDKVDMGSALPLWRSEYLAKVSLKPIEGYRSGYVLYGNCKNNGRIIRIKMTYENDSKEFYDRLRSLLGKRYGKSSEWRGNPFSHPQELEIISDYLFRQEFRQNQPRTL